LDRYLIKSDFRELMFVRVADYGGDAGQGGDFLGRALGVASGDDNSCQWVLALHTADGGAGVLIRRIRNGAGVQNYQVGLGGRGRRQAASFELSCESGAIGLGGAASEVLYVIRGHRTIVAHAGADCSG
jgi:hypothetical protein